MYFLCSNSSALLSYLKVNFTAQPSLSPESLMASCSSLLTSLLPRDVTLVLWAHQVCFFFFLFFCLFFFIFGLRVFEVALTLLKHVHFWPALPFPSSICENGLLWIRPSLTIYLNYFLFPSPSSTFLTYRFIFISWFNVYLICLIAVTNPLKFKCDRVTDFCQFS